MSDNEEEDAPQIEITPVFPLSDAELDFDVIDCLPTGPDTNIVEDYELCVGSSVVVYEMLGVSSQIAFFTNCQRQFLVFHFKASERYLNMTLIVSDDLERERTFHLSNKRSAIIIQDDLAEIPIHISGNGWQRLCLDLDALVLNAFGTSFVTCLEITVTGSCRLSKLYFQSRHYSDAELPPFLRVAAVS